MYEYNGEKVIIMLCSKCNVKCEHCYIKYCGNFLKEDIMNLFNSLKDKYTIILNGTEPILFSEYYEIYKNNLQHRIMTNGLELIKNPNLYSQLKENGIDEIGLSYHFGIQDDISFIKSEMLNNLIPSLVKNGFKVKIMTTLSSDNYKDVLNMCEKASNLGAKTIKFTNYIFQGNAQNHEFLKVLNKDQIQFVLDEIDAARKVYSENDLRIERCGTFGPKNNKENKFECLAGNNMVAITPDLNVYQCVFDIDKGNEIGKVIDHKIMIYDKYQSFDKTYCKVLKKYNHIGGNN